MAACNPILQSKLRVVHYSAIHDFDQLSLLAAGPMMADNVEYCDTVRLPCIPSRLASVAAGVSNNILHTRAHAYQHRETSFSYWATTGFFYTHIKQFRMSAENKQVVAQQLQLVFQKDALQA